MVVVRFTQNGIVLNADVLILLWEDQNAVSLMTLSARDEKYQGTILRIEYVGSRHLLQLICSKLVVYSEISH